MIMKRNMMKAGYVIVIVISMMILSPPLLYGEPTGVITYQGQLLNNTGNPANGTVDMGFKIYSSAGSVLWEEEHSDVTVDSGLYTVLLGSETPIPSSVFTSDETYLELSVNGEALSPRQRITAVGHTLVARTVMGPDMYISPASGKVGIGTSSPAEKLDVAGTVKATGFKLSTDAVSGYVLTSDADGNATWKSAGSIAVTNETDPIFTNWVATNTDWTGTFDGQDGSWYRNWANITNHPDIEEGNWSGYPATQDVNIAGFNVTNINSASIGSELAVGTNVLVIKNGKVGFGTNNPIGNIICLPVGKGIYFEGVGAHNFAISCNGYGIQFTGAASGSAFKFNRPVWPSSDLYADLGGAGRRWKTFYSRNITDVTGSTTIGAPLTVTDNIRSDGSYLSGATTVIDSDRNLININSAVINTSLSVEAKCVITPSAASGNYILDTSVAVANGDTMVSFKNNGSQKVRITGYGKIYGNQLSMTQIECSGKYYGQSSYWNFGGLHPILTLASANRYTITGGDVYVATGSLGIGMSANVAEKLHVNGNIRVETNYTYMVGSTPGLNVTNVIVGYDGATYTTNTIIVLGGIITSWIQAQ